MVAGSLKLAAASRAELLGAAEAAVGVCTQPAVFRTHRPHSTSFGFGGRASVRDALLRARVRVYVDVTLLSHCSLFD